MLRTTAGQAEKPLTFASTTSPVLTSGAAAAGAGGVLDILSKIAEVVENERGLDLLQALDLNSYVGLLHPCTSFSTLFIKEYSTIIWKLHVRRTHCIASVQNCLVRTQRKRREYKCMIHIV